MLQFSDICIAIYMFIVALDMFIINYIHLINYHSNVNSKVQFQPTLNVTHSVPAIKIHQPLASILQTETRQQTVGEYLYPSMHPCIYVSTHAQTDGQPKNIMPLAHLYYRHTHTHTHPFNSPFSGTTRGGPVPER